MASARINYNPSSKLGNQISRAVSSIVGARKELAELDRILQKYIDAEADITTDSGIDAGSVSLVRNLVTQASNELGGVVSVALAVNDASGCRQLADAMGSMG